MSIVRIYILSVIVGISFLAFGSVDSAYAIDFVLSDAASCTGLPGGGETWDGSTSTCTKTSNLSIIVGNTLTVTNGVTLAFPDDDNLVNRGTITNNGIINITEGLINNRNSGTFTNSGTIILNGTGNGNGRLLNQDSASFTNSGTITIEGSGGTSGRLLNRESAAFTNSGTITITGINNNSGQLRNQNSAAFTNSGTITITGINNNSGQLRNQNSADFTNSGTITIDGTNNNSGQLRNLNSATFTNTITGINNINGLVTNRSILTNLGSFITNNGFNNNNANSEITNSGTIQVTLNLNNNNGLIVNTCGEITFGSLSGNPIQEETCQTTSSSGSSNAYDDPTIGKSKDGIQVVENGICIDVSCWTVIADFHQDFELVEMLSDSTHTITTTVFCQHGVSKCNYVAFGVSPYGTNINDSVWKIILQKDHLDSWTMKVIDPEGYLGEVTSTTQIVNDNRYISASATIEFKKPTPGMILNIEVRDSGGGYRDFKFNDGIAIADAYAYPSIETSYEQPLEIAPLCLNENPNKRYTCAFDKVRDWTIRNAEAALEQITK